MFLLTVDYSHSYIADDDVPEEFTWMNVDGKNYLTHLINQHVSLTCV